MNRTPRFTGRRVQNLKEISVVSPLQHSPPSSGPSPTFDDSDEDDADLKALRQAALASRKSETRPAPSIGNGRLSNSTGHHLPPVPVKQVTSTVSTGTINSRPNTSGRRQPDMSSNHTRASQQASVRPSKYDNLDLEDLRLVYKASKRSRFDRRNNSDESSSEDDDFDYVKTRRADTSDHSPRPRFERNGYHSGGSSLSPPPHEAKNISLQAATEFRNDHRHTSPLRHHSNLTSIPPNQQQLDEQERLGASEEAAMERRRQKFQSGAGPVSAEEKTKVSLASLKSHSSSISQDLESMHKTTSD